MAVDNSVAPAGWPAEQIGACEPDVLQSMVKTMAEALMSAEADSVCGADYGTRSDERVNRRNGYRSRDWDTRASTVELAIPSCGPAHTSPNGCWSDAVRAEQALVSVVATSYLLGVSTRRLDKLVEQMGIKGISKSQVSETSKVLDAQVRGSATGPWRAVCMRSCGSMP
ncbi:MULTISPECIES: transposase [unclassified Actinomadura]|uniref:transposase n=1 Tax=unclassified Actinomadura TaxID=2626254 RepID=UPI0022855BF9|nr:transposase [Actinomadura sp. K4S16]